MKCKDCGACRKGFFESKPEAYVCIGVQEPFVIEDIDKDCTEYPEKNNAPKDPSSEDKLGQLITDIYKLIGDPVDYAELIGSEVPSTYGMYYVYTEPEHVLLNVAARMLVTQAMEIDELSEEITGLKKVIDIYLKELERYA